jgi:branched-chain amino acid transport system substrate-binding protein
MVHSSFHFSAAICTALAIWATPVAAQTAGGAANLSGGKVKIGVLTDIAGPTAMTNGKGSVIAAEMAAEDFGAGLNVEVISADHSGKPDVGSQIAARWFDVEGVDAIADMQGSPIGFAVQNLAAQKSKIMLLSGSTSSISTARPAPLSRSSGQSIPTIWRRARRSPSSRLAARGGTS